MDSLFSPRRLHVDLSGLIALGVLAVFVVLFLYRRCLLVLVVFISRPLAPFPIRRPPPSPFAHCFRAPYHRAQAR